MRLTFHSLGHGFQPGHTLFRNLSTSIEPGELVAVTGPSGSGKTTLLSLVAGWLAPTEGTIDRDGIDVIAWVFQNPHGVPRRTALDHVALPLLARGATRRQASGQAADVLAQFNLAHLADQEFRSLSGGEAQRLMLGRAVATAPHLLLVDEPTAQLDRATAGSVNQVLARIASQNSIVLVATHDPDTRAACTRVLDLGALPTEQAA